MSYLYEDDYEEIPVRRTKAKSSSGTAPKKRSASAASSAPGKRTASSASGARKSASAGTRKSVSSSSGRTASSSVRRSASGASQARKRSSASTASGQRYHDYNEYPVHRSASSNTRKRRKKQKRANPLLVLLAWVLAVAVAFVISNALHEHVFEIIRVSGDNMYETLMNNDLALVTKYDYKDSTPERGDVVVVDMGDQNGYMLRRIVGLPGESIEIIGGETQINQSVILEQYVSLKTYDSFEGKTMPPDKYYLLGDNRSETNDSRDPKIGLIDQSDIIGKVKWVIWPLNHLGGI